MPSSKVDFFAWQELDSQPVIGVDEVGRGCLAGPVYAAAVIVNPQNDYSLYTDSKALSASRREVLSEHIKTHHQWCIAFATVDEISRLNILWAAMLAMKRAVLGLNVQKGHVLVDGNQRIPDLSGYKQTTLIKGDLRAAPVAAASIIAKVARDRWMQEQSKIFPQYAFDQHKGYSTKKHQEAIAKWGPCSLHRPTFAGVKEYISS